MKSTPPYGRDFWPRSRRPDVAADFDFDRPCGNCGYNLRGLSMHTPCPECGSVGGFNTSDDELSFNDRQNPLTFIDTLLLVIFRPRSFARLVWNPRRFDIKSAKLFRRISLLIGVVSLCIVAQQLTDRIGGPLPAMCAVVIDAAAFIVWMNSVSLDSISFIKQTASPAVRRAETLAHYTSAIMVLTPIQLLLLPITLKMDFRDEGWLLVVGLHLALLAVQLLIGSLSTAWMFFELVDVTPTRALGFTLARSMTAVASAIPMLLFIPAMAAALAFRWFGG